jgi:hypothetical protein
MAVSSAKTSGLFPKATIPDLKELSVRELLVRLAELEDKVRALPPLVVFSGRLIVNPERRPFLLQQRAVVAQLRSRRALLRSGDTTRRATTTTHTATPAPRWT